MKLLDRFPDDYVGTAAARRLCPSIDDELALMPDREALRDVRADIGQSRTFTEDGFVSLLDDAIALLKRGKLHESCVASYQMLLPIYARRSDYGAQRDWYFYLFL